MTTNQNALLDLIKIGTSGNCLFGVAVLNADWQKLFELACQQGVVCVTWRAIEILYKREVNECPQDVKLNWYVQTQNIINSLNKKKLLVKEFVDTVAPHKLAVLKGVHYTEFWPKPEWREFGDLDCYSIEEKPHEVEAKAREAGCRFEEDDYKHSHIYHKNMMIENHRSFTSFAGTRETRMQEIALRGLFEQGYSLLEDTGLYAPNINFTAVYMLVHARNHFFYEGLSLRQILDWHFFLTKEGRNVDWQQVEDVLERTKLRAFAVLLTQICKRHFGLRFNRFGSDSSIDDELVAMFLDDVFAERYNDHDRRWYKMVERMLHRYYRMWIFRSLMHMPIHKAIWRSMAYSSFFHRKPEL